MIKLTTELAELTGILYGDGCLSAYKGYHIVYICGHKFDDYEYHDKNTRSLFLKTFQREINIEKRKDENTIIIRFNSKEIFYIFHSLGMPIGKKYSQLHIPIKFSKHKKLLFAFIRGVIDTDGSVVLSKQHKSIPYYPRIEISSKSGIFLTEIYNFLKENGFYGSISHKLSSYKLEIPGFKNLDRWLKKIGFSNPKHLNKIKKIRLRSDSN